MFSVGALDFPALSRRHTSGLSRNPLAPEPRARRLAGAAATGVFFCPQHAGGCASPRSALTPIPPGTHAMITDAAVEAATAVLEERGWERDEEMVEDVRAALEAAQAELAATRPRRGAASPASARGGRPRASVRRAGGTSRPRPAPADGRVPARDRKRPRPEHLPYRSSSTAVQQGAGPSSSDRREGITARSSAAPRLGAGQVFRHGLAPTFLSELRRRRAATASVRSPRPPAPLPRRHSGDQALAELQEAPLQEVVDAGVRPPGNGVHALREPAARTGRGTAASRPP